MAFYRFCTARQIWFLACIDFYKHTCKCKSLFSKARLVCLSPNCRFFVLQLMTNLIQQEAFAAIHIAQLCKLIAITFVQCDEEWNRAPFWTLHHFCLFLNANYLHLLLNHIFHHTSISIMHLSMAQVQVCMQSFQLQYTCHKLLPLLLFQNAING